MELAICSDLVRDGIDKMGVPARHPSGIGCSREGYDSVQVLAPLFYPPSACYMCND